MRTAKKAFLLTVAALGGLALVAALLLAPAPREVIGAPHALTLLKAFPWVHASKNAELGDRSFVMSEEQGFRDLSSFPESPFRPEADQALFELDRAEFLRQTHATSFREAQLKYFAGKKLDPATLRYDVDRPRLRAWGGLPYPPLHALAAGKARPLGASPADALYQLELDRFSGTELTANDEVRLYQNGETLKPLLDVVEHARKFVYLNFLSLDCDRSTEELFRAVEAKSAAGVDVRIVVNKNYALLGASCLERLKRAKVDVVKAKTHSSYAVSDQGEVVIGSVSLARMFFRSTGFNFLDRDLMLWARGPVATDVLRDFLAVW
ncbi:MAG: phosphatidylserine/phosphatidylglycerophosphate/cardiolipin synthase family protein, partial [Deltaproteobacteria bacterium]|nr:phosphatidylserine/phosphatidylglycerophosphate/cardiolipin synthase family protein [Deltaproteobacteria bacterium]